MRQASCGSMIPPIILYLLCIYLLTYYLVFAAAARIKHPAGHANIICLFIIYYLFNACISSMREAFCGSMMPPIIIFIHYY